MSRSVAWRRVVSDAASWRQDQALNSTMYILRETGPTGFLLKEEGEIKKFKVYLGDPHKCSCAVFRKEKDVCKHICWLLMKKFRIPRHDPVSWQIGLVEREINEVLRGHLAADAPRRRGNTTTVSHKQLSKVADGRAVLEQKIITEDDVCPICQEELLEKKLPVTFCKFGCGNSIHIKCMKVWAEHQKSQSEKVIKCPLCREDFGPFELLKQEGRNADQISNNSSRNQLDRHIWVTCRSCQTNPVIGKCYRCTSCVDYHLCQSCFNTPVHVDHNFQYRQKRNERWRPAQRSIGLSLPQAVMNDLLNRDISESDYDLLLQLDSVGDAGNQSVPAEVLESFPMERVRESSQLLAPGAQCRICLRGYTLTQFVRKLPCKHKFHRDCIDPWLLHSHVTCPVDGLVVWSPLATITDDNNNNTPPQRHREGSGRGVNSSHPGLEIPGVGLSRGISLPTTATQPRREVEESQRPTIPNYRDGQIPLGLEGILNGTALNSYNSSGETTLSSLSHPVEDSLGSRLLARARLRQKKISRHLTSIHGDRIKLEPVAPSIPASREITGLSAGITGTQHLARLDGSSERTTPDSLNGTPIRGRSRHRTLSLPQSNNQPLDTEFRPPYNRTRRRSTSRERPIQNQMFEELFLGNGPGDAPGRGGAVLSSGMTRRYRPKPQSNRPPPHPARNRHLNLELEGNAVTRLL